MYKISYDIFYFKSLKRITNFRKTAKNPCGTIFGEQYGG